MNLIQKIIKKFNKLKQDKKDHFYLGIIIGFPLVLAFGLIGGIIAIVLVALKEIINDLILKKGEPELLDFIYSAIPIIMFILLKYI